MKKAYSRVYILVIVIVPFLGTILAIGLLWQRTVHWSDLTLLAALYTLTALGMTAGFHRMLTHRSFQAHPVVKVSLLVFGSMAAAEPPIEFAATHIRHHVLSDREGDPHSPARSGWMPA